MCVIAYNKPPLFVRTVFNRLAMVLGLSGTVTLAVPRRRTAETQTVPVVPAHHGDDRFLVSTRGESDWVRNLRASGARAELRTRSGREAISVTEVPVGERGPILAAYRANAGRVVEGYFTKLPDEADHPTFRIVSS